MSVSALERPTTRQYAVLAVFLAATLAVGGLGSVATLPEIPGWYAGLHKPPFNPPNWVFGPVWTALYILMAVAAWRVWRRTGLRSRAMTLFALQLGLNLAWSFIFFAAHATGAALIELVALDTLIVWTAIRFARIDAIAGWLFVPYIAWAGFATLLNAAICMLN
ncbi:MAG: tryptophan-rich sensory protein [Proteobacteria bacterium]|nr:tryptophan-rich sensory protein [Pseudomonadota bacterium]